MKKTFAFLLAAFAVMAVLAACTPQKQACAAYSEVELEESAK